MLYMNRILVVDDDFAIGRTLQLHLGGEGYDVTHLQSVEEALQKIASINPNLILLDLRLGGMGGLDGLPLFKAALPDVRIVIMTAHHDMDSTITAMQRGADEYLHKPLDLNELDEAVTKALAFQHYDGECQEIDIPDNVGRSLVGSCHAMKEIYKTIGMVSNTPATILITGESGTGKEMIARAVHQCSDRRDAPFVAINCAALIDTLLESDMFGHKKGSFTGATSDQQGKFQLAAGGTLFLDEVGELSLKVQAKLLRVLQEKEFTPLGSNKTITSSCRVITATNVDLQKAVEDKLFREDLYYRLQVINIAAPPLRERREDINDLVKTLLSRANKELNRRIVSVAPGVMALISAYDWPGNVRELENVLIKAVALCQGNTLTLDLFPEKMHAVNVNVDVHLSHEYDSQSLQEIERRHVSSVLDKMGGHKGKTCEILGVSRPRLQRLISQYNLAY